METHPLRTPHSLTHNSHILRTMNYNRYTLLMGMFTMVELLYEAFVHSSSQGKESTQKENDRFICSYIVSLENVGTMDYIYYINRLITTKVD